MAATQMAADKRYWAFLSYSHADQKLASWIHRAIESYSIPKRLIGRPTVGGPAPRRLTPIFRDRADLAARPDLEASIQSALEHSVFLIVVCSPSAAKSSWVNQEVARFRELHGSGRILAVIAAGEPFATDSGESDQECFPEALRGAAVPGNTRARVEPVAADLRQSSDSRRMAKLKLIAGMLDVGLDELVHRDAQRRHRQLLGVTTASLAASAAMAALTAVALKARDAASAQQGQSEGLVEFMLVDLRKTLEPAGRLDALDAVGNRALAYYAKQPSQRLDPQSLARRARVLHLLGDIRDKRGDLGGALHAFQEASLTTAQLLAQSPNSGDRIFDHAQSVYWVGYVAWRRGQARSAQASFREYQRLADRLVELDPGNDDWRSEVGYANSNLGTVLLEEGQAREAAQAFARALTVSAELARRKPADRQRRMDLAQSYAWLADAEFAAGDADQSFLGRTEERRIYMSLLASSPDDEDAELALAINRHAVAKVLLTRSQPDAAILELTKARDAAERLVARHPDNLRYQAEVVPIHLLLARADLKNGNLAGAMTECDRGLSLSEHLVRKDPTVAVWKGELLGGARVLHMQILARTGVSEGVAFAPAAAELNRLRPLSAARPHDASLAGVVAEAAYLAGQSAQSRGDKTAARSLWLTCVDVLSTAKIGPGSRPLDPGQVTRTKALERLKATAAA